MLTLTKKNSRQTTLWEFCDLDMPKPKEVRKKEWEDGFLKIMRREYEYDEDGKRL